MWSAKLRRTQTSCQAVMRWGLGLKLGGLNCQFSFIKQTMTRLNFSNLIKFSFTGIHILALGAISIGFSFFYFNLSLLSLFLINSMIFFNSKVFIHSITISACQICRTLWHSYFRYLQLFYLKWSTLSAITLWLWWFQRLSLKFMIQWIQLL